MSTFDEAALEGNETAAGVLAGLAMAEVKEVIPGHVWLARNSDGAPGLMEINSEKYEDRPANKRGEVKLFTAESLARYVNDHSTPGTALYGDWTTLSVVAILDGHEPNKRLAIDGLVADTIGRPQWAEHRAELKLRYTPEWTHWASLNGKMVDQVAFAEHIENGADEIIEPSAADMLEVAQTLHVSRAATFRSGTRLSDGRVQFIYSEDQQSTAGERGDIEIPSTFRLSIAPFEGSEPYEVGARLRWRLSDGHQLALAYKLIRPDVVLRTAFADVLDAIETVSGFKPLTGTPPTRSSIAR